VRVLGDERRVAQVFANLLSNAARYTEPGGHIAIRARVEDAEVAISVSDDGRGIAHDLMPRLFEPFVQGHATVDRRHGGLGLGLTIVRTLVRLHGGTIAAHSAGPGLGSEFTVRLPVYAAASTGAESDLEMVDPRAAGAGHRVLVVDDNVDAAEVLVQALALMGYAAEARHDGPSAVARVMESRPAAVLLDIGLPVMDGYEVARRIRAMPDGRQVQLIAVTGYGQERDREMAIEAGFDEHMVKPIRIEMLLEVLERLKLPSGG
jgi:CheY-like chemotaxis protein